MVFSYTGDGVVETLNVWTKELWTDGQFGEVHESLLVQKSWMINLQKVIVNIEQAALQLSVLLSKNTQAAK